MKNNYFSNHIRLKKWAISWLIIVIGLLFFASYLLPNSKINSSVLSLLPQEQNNNVPIDLINGFQDRLDKQIVWLIKPATNDEIQAVQWWYNTLKQQDFIQDINGQFDQNFQQDWGVFAYQYRYQLADPQTINRLREQTQFDWVLSQIYSPFSGISVNELNNDPLLLTRSAQINQLSTAGNLSITNNWLTGKDNDGNTWYMLYGELTGSSFNMKQSHQIVNQLSILENQLKQQWPNTEILKRGVIFYSDNAATQAKSDISTIGTLSMLGIIFLILAVFRSIRPILLTLLSIAIGILCGTIAVLVIFGEIHIMTIVMSSSIIGVAIDYSLHYLTERLLHGDRESPNQSLTKLLPTLVIALYTSLITYLILLITPFPGLKQLSIFACFGLIGAFLSVILWYPFLVHKLQVRANTGQTLLTLWLNLWQKKAMQLSMIFAALIFIGVGLANLTIDDDIGRLQTIPPILHSEEQQIIAITKQSTDQKWFIVYGETPEKTLQHLEQFLPKLEDAKQKGILTQYQTINLPSKQKQQQNIAIIEQYSPDIITALQQLGLDIKFPSIEKVNHELITPELWLQHAISQGRKLLWFSEENGHSAALIPISGITNINAVKQLAQNEPGVEWLDRRQEFNNMFTNYRVHLTQLLIATIIVICLSFIYRNRHHGVKMALKSTLPILLSVGCALSIQGFTQQPLNLFSMLALILVIGIGIDYSLFLSNHSEQKQSALLAVSMAALTTLLSFGLLVLSHTSAIVGFGLVLVGGIFAAFLFAPLVIKPHYKK
ncbi:MMPL family transporter [Orbus mooreae]|uniref:MMPL family transporter n=1 Tax=Orbus mooreae TaxID=3074107 RepID=UPI00370D945A